MIDVIVLIFILLVNIVAIFIIYKMLGDIQKKEKLIFIIVGIAVIYMLVSFTYWLSTMSIDAKDVSESGKTFITFTFVPVNGVVLLPFLASSYKNFKNGRLNKEKLRNRCIIMVSVLVVLLIIEYFYFKDIQLGVINMIQNK